MLRDRSEQQRRFHRRETVPDALARPSAKREISKSRQPLHQITFPSLGKKFLRRIEPSRIAVNHPLRQGNTAALGDRVSADLRIFDRQPRHTPRRGIQPHRFGDHVTRVAQVRQVVQRWRAACQHGRKFGVQFRFHRGILREQQPSPRERVRRRFVPCQKNRHRFIAQLPVAHARTIFVLCREQHRQQIAGIFPRRAPLVDKPENDLVQTPRGDGRADIPRRRQPRRCQDELTKIRIQLHDSFQRMPDLPRFAIHVRVEKRLRHNLQR